MYLLIKYIKSVFWRVAKCLSYIEEARCLKVNRPEVVTRKLCFRSPVFIKHFFLYCGADSPSAGLAVQFLFILYMDETRIAIGLIQSVTVITDHRL